MDPASALPLVNAGGIGVAVLVALMAHGLLGRAIDAWGKRRSRRDTPPSMAAHSDVLGDMRRDLAALTAMMAAHVNASGSHHVRWRDAHDDLVDLVNQIRLDIAHLTPTEKRR